MPPPRKDRRKRKQRQQSARTDAAQETVQVTIVARSQCSLPPEMFKLGSVVTDTASGLSGILTHFMIELGGSMFYNLQPRGLNPEDGSPVKKMWLSPARIQGAELVPAFDLPLQVLGTRCEDTGSGFAGIATALIQHISGCAHVTIQPQGINKKDGGHIDPHDFDLRRCRGAAIPLLTELERQQSQKQRPSPMPVTFRPHRPL